MESMNMIEAGDHHGVENNEDGDEIPGRRSIERAKTSGSESEVFCMDASAGFSHQPSTEEATPKVAEKLNLEKQESELEAYILDKLSGLQPSFKTLFEPSVVGSTGSSSENKTGQEAGKSKWKKKIEDAVAKVSAKKQLQSILYETDVKGILKMRWEEERKKGQRRRWPRLGICCHRRNSTGKSTKEWEFQLEEYISTW